MTIECGFCKGTGIEPGFTECVWCDNTGLFGHVQPHNLKRALAEIKAVQERQNAVKVHRYQVVTMLSMAGATIGYDPHGPDVVMAAEFDRVTSERDALQSELTKALELLGYADEALKYTGLQDHLVDFEFVDAVKRAIKARIPQPAPADANGQARDV